MNHSITPIATGHSDVFDGRNDPHPYRVTIASAWIVSGGRYRCRFCDDLIRDLDLDFEVETGPDAHRHALHFHGRCYDQWVAAGSLLGQRCASLLPR